MTSRHHHRHQRQWRGKNEKRTKFPQHLLTVVVLARHSKVWVSCMASRSNILCRVVAGNVTHLRQQRQRAQVNSLVRSEKPIRFLRVENDGLKPSPALRHHRRQLVVLGLAISLLARNLIAVEVRLPDLSNSTTLPQTERSRGSTLSMMRSGRRASTQATSQNVSEAKLRMLAGSVGGPQDQEGQRVQLIVIALLVQLYPSLLPVRNSDLIYYLCRLVPKLIYS